MYTYLNDSDRHIISKIVGKLPFDVQEYVDECCEFLCINANDQDSPGFCVSTYAVDYFVIQGPHWRGLLGGGKTQLAEVTVVHEITHAWAHHSEFITSGQADIDRSAVSAWLRVNAWGWDTEDMEGLDDLLVT